MMHGRLWDVQWRAGNATVATSAAFLARSMLRARSAKCCALKALLLSSSAHQKSCGMMHGRLWDGQWRAGNATVATSAAFLAR